MSKVAAMRQPTKAQMERNREATRITRLLLRPPPILSNVQEPLSRRVQSRTEMDGLKVKTK